MYYKKILLIFTLISVSLITFSQETIEVQLVSISNIYNNSVGNEWSHNVTVNKKALTKYKNLSFKLTETNTLSIKVSCSEYDEKYSDNSSNIKIIDLSKIDLSNEYLFTIEVTVTENGGRYKGNTAKWKYKFKII
ncbi:MAG: hypothetical protein KAR57_04105 [Bacteroidales bacterium]|nr:hypothetical protein [Bacteroidales bacterium]